MYTPLPIIPIPDLIRTHMLKLLYKCTSGKCNALQLVKYKMHFQISISKISVGASAVKRNVNRQF